MVPLFALPQAGGLSASSGFVGYLITIGAIGVITMALIQTTKDLLPVRRAFQRAHFRTWLAQGAAEAAAPDRATALAEPGGATPLRLDADAAEQRIVSLATDGDRDALYTLPVEQMCGQVNAALQVVLEYPARDRNVVAIVASQAPAADLATVFDAAALAGQPGEEFVGARTRVMHQFQRAIDAFQIATSYRWKLLMQVVSLVLCGGLTFAAMRLHFHVGLTYLGPWGAVLVGAVLAGFLAPVMRDVTAALQTLRK